jgi:dimethylaniline monooxygenase (N-oxide forming)
MPPKTRTSATAPTDVIIIGAGWFGLSAAKTFLAIDPSVSLSIIDNGESVGGVWSKSRVYPRLVLNQPTPHMEYSDLSMSELFGGLEDYSDIQGNMATKYLETYAEKHDLLKRCRFNTHVVRIEREPEYGPWKIITRPSNNPEAEVEELTCTKLIVSTGHETVENFPPGLDLKKFTGTVFHSKEVGKRHDEIVADENLKTVTVVGGNKSAFEIAANFGLAGKKVNWLIREDGQGPGMMICDRSNGKDHDLKGVTARAVSALAPSPFNPQRWITRFLYGGKYWFGRWFEVWFWKVAFKKHLELYKRPNLDKIKPLSER